MDQKMDPRTDVGFALLGEDGQISAEVTMLSWIWRRRIHVQYFSSCIGSGRETARRWAVNSALCLKVFVSRDHCDEYSNTGYADATIYRKVSLTGSRFRSHYKHCEYHWFWARHVEPDAHEVHPV